MAAIIIVIELIIRIILGYIGKSIGKKRVIGSTIGFVLGFLLGLIGLLIAVCFKKKPQPQIAATTTTNPQATATELLQKQELQQPLYEDVFSSEGSSEQETVNYELHDESILHAADLQNDAYLYELLAEVCVRGESLKKYERMVIKKYNSEVYSSIERFVDELSHYAQRGHFTNTSKANLGYLGCEMGLSKDAVEDLISQVSCKVS